MEGPFHDLGSSDGRISSVLDLLNKSADKSLCSLLKSDDLARESFVRLGVPLGSDSDRLRFRNWGVRHKEVQEDISFASWSPGGAALCLLSRTGALCIAPASAPLERVSVALHQEGSRARWLGEEVKGKKSGVFSFFCLSKKKKRRLLFVLVDLGDCRLLMSKVW